MTLYRRLHFNVDRRDPTNTGRIVRGFEKEVLKRLRELQKAVYEWLVENETIDVTSAVVTTNAPFKFESSQQKIDAFKKWLARQQKKGLLQTIPGPAQGERPWSDVYIESAYQKGVAQSVNRMKGEGVQVSASWVDTAFNRPMHADRAGILFTRTFDDLEGISAAISSKLSSVLTQGMIDGKGVRDITREMQRQIAAIGKPRAQRLVRTEIINAHAEATLNTYDEAGMEGVEVLSEFATAGDNKVCRRCEALEGKKYTIAEARGVIPVHPNCRCAWLPVVGKPKNPIRLG